MKIRLSGDGWLTVSFNSRDMAYTSTCDDTFHIKPSLLKSLAKRAAKLTQVVGEKV